MKPTLSICAFRLLGSLPVLIAAGVLGAQVFGTSVEARIQIRPANDSHVSVDYEFAQTAPEIRAFSLRRVGSLAVEKGDQRLQSVRAFDSSGTPIKLRDGSEYSYFSSAVIKRISYKVNLNNLGDPFEVAHRSWASKDFILLMLRDLLPEAEGVETFSIEFAGLPKGGTVLTSEDKRSETEYLVRSPDSAVFLISHSARLSEEQGGGMTIRAAITGEWQFSDGQVISMAAEISDHYRRLFGKTGQRRSFVFLLPVEDDSIRDRWRAETIGNSVVIVSSPSTYRNLGEQRIHEQLRHELFHLWVPNSLVLTGPYAWFYEGFAQYRSLVAGVELGQIRESDVLASLAQALSGAARRREWHPPLSSGENGVPSDSSIYSSSMALAFAIDTELIVKGRRKNGSDEVLRSLMKIECGQTGCSASDTLMALLRRYPELSRLMDRSIQGGESPDWDRILTDAGLANLSKRPFFSLRPVNDPGSRQRAMLKRLGYNIRR